MSLLFAAAVLSVSPTQTQQPVAPAPATQCTPEHAAMGHCTLAPPVPPSTPAAPAATAACTPEHAAMGHCTLAPAAPADAPCTPEHAAMGHCKPDAAAAPTSAVPPVRPPPRAAFAGPEHAADTVYDPALMTRKRATALIGEHGGMITRALLIDRIEYAARDGRDGYRWDAQGWYGGDYNKLWVKSEGEGAFGESPEQAEVQALYSRAIGAWFDAQIGVRQDFRPTPRRTHLAVGVQGLAPYWFEVDAAVFLSQKGELTARIEAEYDQRITNKLILQPLMEFDLSAQDVPALGLGSGLTAIEAGLRLRYQFVPEFAPYLGVSWERALGDTARFARAAGDGTGGLAFVLGVRAWF